jgi:hypothetical protein
MSKFIKTWEAFTKDSKIGEYVMARIERYKLQGKDVSEQEDEV